MAPDTGKDEKASTSAQERKEEVPSEVGIRPKSPADSDEEKVTHAENQITEFQLKASLFDEMRAENEALRRKIETMADVQGEKRRQEPSKQEQTETLAEMITQTMMPFQKLVQDQLRSMQEQISQVSSKNVSNMTGPGVYEASLNPKNTLISPSVLIGSAETSTRTAPSNTAKEREPLGNSEIPVFAKSAGTSKPTMPSTFPFEMPAPEGACTSNKTFEAAPVAPSASTTEMAS
jgi:hypothetical protein